jgi:chromosome segregation ATPase
MPLDEESIAEVEQMHRDNALVDRKSLVTGGLVALISTVIALYATDQVRSTEIAELKDDVGDVADKLDGIATKDDVEAAKEEAVRRSNAYTDRQVGQLGPMMSEQKAVLERLDEDRKDAKADRRALQEELGAVKTSITELKMRTGSP